MWNRNEALIGKFGVKTVAVTVAAGALALVAVALAIAAAGGLPLPFAGQVAPQATTTVQVGLAQAFIPADVGETTTIPVIASLTAGDLYGAQFELRYDPSVIDLHDVSPGGLLRGNSQQDGAGGFFKHVDIDHASGTVLFANTLLQPAAAVSTPGDVAEITFTCTGTGQGMLEVVAPVLANSAGAEIPSLAGPVSYVVCRTAGAIDVDIPLFPGYNLIGVPVSFPETTRARDIAEALLPGGANIEDGPVTAILSWTGAGYLPWLSNNPAANNFEMEPGNGYFVRLQAAVPGDKLTVTGLPFVAPVALDFSAGYNLVSVPFATPGTYDAVTSAQAIDTHDGGSDVSTGPVLSILSWTGVYDFSLRDNSFANSFTLEAARGYFVRMAQAVLGFDP